MPLDCVSEKGVANLTSLQTFTILVAVLVVVVAY